MLDYFEAVHAVIKFDGHSFELIDLPQRHTLPNVGRDGSFPDREDTKDYITESYFSLDGTIQ